MHPLTEEEGKLALQAARAFAESAVKHEEVKDIELPKIFNEERGVFVTLTDGGELRGCIGFPYPTAPLGEALRNRRARFARRDHARLSYECLD